jgi:hypothetical protein
MQCEPKKKNIAGEGNAKGDRKFFVSHEALRSVQEADPSPKTSS